jgi:hypothetical protein
MIEFRKRKMAKRLVARAITHADNPRDFVEQAMALARREVEHYGELLSVAYCFEVGGRVRMAPIHLASDLDKSQLGIFLALLANQPDTDCVVFLAEAWVQEFDPPLDHSEAVEYQTLKRKTMMSLEQFPGRREAILARIQSRDRMTIAIWKYGHDSLGKPVFDEKMEWGDDLPHANVVASGPRCDFSNPVDCARFMQFVIDEVMARPGTSFPVTPRIVVIHASLEESLPEFLVQLFPKADGMVNVLAGYYENVAQLEAYIGNRDPLGVRDVRDRMAKYPDADLIVYAIFPKAAGNSMALPMYRDGEQYQFGSPSQPLSDS